MVVTAERPADNLISIRNLGGDSCLHVVDEQAVLSGETASSNVRGMVKPWNFSIQSFRL